jgi:16S rRNA (cytosine1402-N4)-methyltransferase
MGQGREVPHRPVLLTEAVAALAVRPAGQYVDCTYGRGGHTAAILDRLGSEGRLLALDRDPEAVAAARERCGGDRRFTVCWRPFSMLESELTARGLTGRVDGILLDLGVASPQLEDRARGFSFDRTGPLDMRMNPEVGRSAADWLAGASTEQIANVLRQFGEERFARRIARAIVQARSVAPIRTTQRLAEIVAAAVPRREPGKHPATRTFQAIRIFVNDELTELEAVLDQSPRALALGGRLVVISFHSLEDRMVKRFMRAAAKGDAPPAGLPVRESALPAGRLRVVAGPVRPSVAEVRRNPRARSAIMRAAERI